MALDLTALIMSGAGTALGFVTGAVQTGLSAEGRYSKRVDARLLELEAKVLQCEAERPQIAILKMGASMMAAELQSKDRGNPVLRQVAAAFATLPQDGSLDELMRELDGIPGTNELQRGKNERD